MKRPQGPGRNGSRARAAYLLAVGSSAALGSCIVGDDHCSKYQVRVVEKGKFDYCSCADNAIPDPQGYGCIPCGEHELVQAGACVCAAGYARENAAAGCEAIPEGQTALAQACSSATDCGAPYPFCAGSGSDKYCTKSDCSKDTDCPTDYWCDASGDTPYCHRPATGLNKSCSSASDCAGYDAAYCETFQAKVCMVSDCASGANPCHGSYGCCDLTALVGSPLSLCIANSQLTGGLCPTGAPPVTP
jgi:hypothetical protein